MTTAYEIDRLNVIQANIQMAKVMEALGDLNLLVDGIEIANAARELATLRTRLALHQATFSKLTTQERQFEGCCRNGGHTVSSDGDCVHCGVSFE